MAIGLNVGNITDEIGTADFFHAFFSTVSGNLEPDGWGTRFPMLMMELYQGELKKASAVAARAELTQIRAELAKLPPNDVIWSFEDRSKCPPWSSNISKDIRDLSNYFVTSVGRDLMGVLGDCVDDLGSGPGTALRVVNC